MSLPRILALDLGSQSGWCCGVVGDPTPRISSVRLGRQGYENGAIAASLCDWLADMITTHDPSLVLYEAPLPRGQHGGIQAGRILLGLAMVTELVCYRREVRCREANVNTVRAQVLGKGNASKDEVMLWCRGQGWQPDDTDASDAAALWAYGCKLAIERRAA